MYTVETTSVRHNHQESIMAAKKKKSRVKVSKYTVAAHTRAAKGSGKKKKKVK